MPDRTRRPIRVRYDDQIIQHQPRGGVSRYFVELVREYRAAPELGVRADADWRHSRNEHAVAAGLGRPSSRWQRRLLRVQRRLPRLPSRVPDLLHPTYYYPDRLPARPGPPMVVTMIDMIPELLPEHWPAGNPHLGKEAYARAADAIVCISESTRRDMLRLYGPLAARIEVVHLGVGPEFRPGIRFPRPLPDDFVLFLGNRANYKDFPVAAEAFAALADARPGLRLVAAGGGRFVRAEEELLERLRITDRVDRVTATDEELPGLFAAARAFVFPSRYEGFGLPTLEAMASGTAVVLADSSSHPEVGGDAALYFAPGDPAALADRLASILDDRGLRERLAQSGLARAATFTWRRTAERTRDVYEAVLAGR